MCYKRKQKYLIWLSIQNLTGKLTWSFKLNSTEVLFCSASASCVFWDLQGCAEMRSTVDLSKFLTVSSGHIYIFLTAFTSPAVRIRDIRNPGKLLHLTMFVPMVVAGCVPIVTQMERDSRSSLIRISAWHRGRSQREVFVTLHWSLNLTTVWNR